MWKKKYFPDEDCEVTRRGSGILLAIINAPEPPRLGKFSRLAEKNLRRNGLLRRVEDPEDAKITCWIPTDKGERILDRLLADDHPPKQAEPAATPRGMNQ